MNITLTRKEFTRLVELAYMGDWVATSMDYGDDNPYEKRYGGLLQKLYRLAATSEDGCPQYFEPDEENEGEFVPSERLDNDSPASRAIDKFTNDTFWEELISRLVERDLDREEDSYKLAPPTMPFEDVEEQEDKRLAQLEDRYRAEFVRKDLENVLVLFGADKHS